MVKAQYMPPEPGSTLFWLSVSAVSAIISAMGGVIWYLLQDKWRGFERSQDHLDEKFSEQTAHIDQALQSIREDVQRVEDESKRRDHEIRSWARSRFVNVERMERWMADVVNRLQSIEKHLRGPNDG
jgi:biopolymer transport protein ExbB/TolQ